MSAFIKGVAAGSPARGKIDAGETLVSINGNPIGDVLDYKFFSYDASLLLLLETPGKRQKIVKVAKPPGADLGLVFESYLMDTPRACANRCVFCFIDQLPAGLRETLYFKDDDARLSFLTGNYITLTNLSDRELRRIIDLKISPINISVHATDPDLRRKMLGNKNAGRCLDIMKTLRDGGITMNCQIVCCAGLNDGQNLYRTMEDLSPFHPYVNSVSIVPVGLTKYRDGLYPLTPFDREAAAALIDMVERFGEKCLHEHGSRIFFASDEMYLKAGRLLPEDSFYEGYPQLENGVGMMRLFITEFESALGQIRRTAPVRPFSVATGAAAAPFLKKLMETAGGNCDTISEAVYTIVNTFFGEAVDVAGLVTGGDLIAQLKGKFLGERLLIPKNMLRSGEDIFLDDVTLREVTAALGVPVRVVMQDGADLAAAIFEK